MGPGMEELQPGTVFAGHRIDALVGQGGMGQVYRATQVALDRTVALKVIVPELAADIIFRERFKREARLAAQLDSPHALPVYEAGESDGALYLAMRFVDGIDLQAILATHGALEPGLAATIIAQVAEALDAAHAMDLVHRDVKPANVLVEERAGAVHAYLTDFGLTKHVRSQSGLTATSMWVGTVDYAAPEQLQADVVDARADVYSLGCVLYEALTGSIPFSRTREVSKILAHVSEPPPRASSSVPGAALLDDVIVRAMAKAPDDRYPTAGELGRAALERAGVTGPVALPDVLRRRSAAELRLVDPGAPTAG